LEGANNITYSRERGIIRGLMINFVPLAPRDDTYDMTYSVNMLAAPPLLLGAKERERESVCVRERERRLGRRGEHHHVNIICEINVVVVKEGTKE